MLQNAGSSRQRLVAVDRDGGRASHVTGDLGEAEMGCSEGHYHEVYMIESGPKDHFLQRCGFSLRPVGWKEFVRPTITVSVELGRGFAIAIIIDSFRRS